jgi:CRP-like cAMP-binding protein
MSKSIPFAELAHSAINKFVSIPEAEMKRFLDAGSEVLVLKGEHFIEAGIVPDRIAFVVSGLFRYYYLSEKGNEFTKGFFPEHTFISSYSAMVQRCPSFYGVQALEDAVLFVIEYDAWQKLLDSHTCWQSLLLGYLTKGYIKKEKREREFLLLDARARYESFLQEYSHLEPRIRLNMIASYLGITPVALSRIRSQLRK